MPDILLVAAIALSYGAVALACYKAGSNHYHKLYANERNNRHLLETTLAATDQEIVEMSNSMEREIERRTAERIRNWTPDLNEIKDDFRRAEAMAEILAKKRDSLNAGRVHPPREDQTGDHAVVGRIRVSKGRHRS